MGALEFTESDGLIYTGSFISLSKSVKLQDASFNIYDVSLGIGALLNPIVSGNKSVIEGGLVGSFIDVNKNNKIDGIDTINVLNAESGDMIKFTYLPTGGVMAQYTFE